MKSTELKEYINRKFRALHRRSKELFYKRLFLRKFVYKIAHQRNEVKAVLLASRIRVGGKARVVFIASNRAMWKYEGIYEKLSVAKEFDVKIVLSPFRLYDIEQQKADLEELRAYFKERKIPFEDFNEEYLDFLEESEHFGASTLKAPIKYKGCFFDLKKYNPDIIFYQQPYERILIKEHDSSHFYNKLLCYCPYALWTSKGDFSYNTDFHNLAWKLFYSTPFHLYDAKMCAKNGGINVDVVGYPGADDYLLREKRLSIDGNNSTSPHSEYLQKSKLDSSQVKNLIWAPHFTIIPERSEIPRSNFLWMADFMLEMAQKYQGKLNIAFKPHPRLYSELCVHPDWGREKANLYYKKWEEMPNTSLETGDYIDLFLHSDGMVHDCGSFSAEYHYTTNPVMFISKDLTEIRKNQGVFGDRVLDLHYLGQNANDIEDFILQKVLNGVDPMKSEREDFCREYLLSREGESVAEKMFESICYDLSLWKYLKTRGE